jgi:hypothetical protein
VEALPVDIATVYLRVKAQVWGQAKLVAAESGHDCIDLRPLKAFEIDMEALMMRFVVITDIAERAETRCAVSEYTSSIPAEYGQNLSLLANILDQSSTIVGLKT